MLCGWLEQAFEAGAQVGRAADVGLGVGFCAVEREDCGGLRKLRERGFGFSGIEGDLFHCVFDLYRLLYRASSDC
jgi:hypothetical protein